MRQILPIKGMDIVAQSPSSTGDIFVASSQGSAGIRRLALLSFADQASMLADQDEFAAALDLAALIPASQVDVTACNIVLSTAECRI
jgi:hypothetical protein